MNATTHPNDFVTCANCAEDKCEHEMRDCPECGVAFCDVCANSGLVLASTHPSWCDRCGFAGDCPTCNPEEGW